MTPSNPFLLRRAGLLAAAALLIGCAATTTTPAPGTGAPPAPAEVRQTLAPTGTLRVGVYPGSPTSLIRGPGPDEQRGLTVEVGRELARRLGVPVRIVVYERVQEIVEAVKAGQADMTITNASAARAREIDFTPALVQLESGYLVPAASPITDPAEVDRPGVRVGVAQGSTSQAVLGRDLKAARVVAAPSVTVATEMLRKGELDAYASNKGILFEMAGKVPGARVLNGRWGLEQLALGLPKERDSALPWLRAFVAESATRDLVRAAAARADLRGLAAD